MKSPQHKRSSSDNVRLAQLFGLMCLGGLPWGVASYVSSGSIASAALAAYCGAMFTGGVVHVAQSFGNTTTFEQPKPENQTTARKRSARPPWLRWMTPNRAVERPLPEFPSPTGTDELISDRLRADRQWNTNFIGEAQRAPSDKCAKHPSNDDHPTTSMCCTVG